ncbi:cyclic nucleotide-binding domain-containing protein [Corallococcus macrosporus]|uniref:Cyclic nucleotide-binding domain-containing protein n=1 Tax=Corallococcus macrosporus TaxID=35 RepID=A0ABS3DM15_9BACT|nr:cyclic nucleotide-binding domain-containing protein [Corallococcus macrosporus]MBN8232379.1 cyclic nucleotide-binding domain-containing protein [Corallococcus macrosporus]
MALVPETTLKACPLFKGFTDTGISIFAAAAVSRAFPKGTSLFTEGKPGDSLLIVGEGTVRLSARSPSGEDIPLGEVTVGEPLGELALVQKGERLCSATAQTDVMALEIRAADFQKLLAAKPQACIKLLMGIVSHFGAKARDNRDMLRTLVARAPGS